MPIPNYSMIRPEIRQSLERYQQYGTPTGSFLEAVLENNLMEAFARADDGNIESMFHIVAYVYNEMDRSCYGSPERVKNWLAVHRLRRREESARAANAVQPAEEEGI